MDLSKLRRAAEDGDAPDAERRDILKAATLVGGAAAVLGAMAPRTAAAQPVQVAQAPALSDKPWWPHPKWGKDDQAGASNWITPAKVLDAVKGIKDGKIYRIGRVYESAMPKYGERTFSVRTTPTGSSYGANRLIGHEEFLAAEVAQTGTQFDGLGHIGIQMGKDGDMTEMRFYNGVTEFEMITAYGLKKLGIENCKPIFTRGHLFDVEAVKGRMLEAGEEIKLADLRAAMTKQNMKEEDIKEGDALFFNTGWGKLWMKNNDKYNSGEPGIGLEVAKWVVDKGACVTGGDCWAVEVVPNPDKNLVFPVHSELICKQGIYNHENLDFTALIADGKHQFAYIFSPAPIRGATGSNGGPIAVT
ncbi:cyclase family protein [Vineibacter terrae]|uniref:Cyclase family protein n=1 Tax=Vineibacter terrae TaxID=2586908 RepID=A0A5C8PVW2_9HYPH|nr:cyclase family protein [Vineibacter terrae]TXL82155.1 cyclase family protein [Vineibacter terrae]